MNIGAQRFATKARTWLLIAGLTALLIGIGALIGGVWLYVFVVLAVAMNVGAYWFSDRLALGVSRASQVEPGTRPNLEAMVRDLARRAELPVPRLYTIRSEQPNAFATGRNPEHAAVAVTEGLLQRLPLDQVKSVLAHEFGHIKNRDTLVSSIVAMVAGAIAAIANLFQFSLLFGGDEDDGRPLGWIGLIGTVIFAPLAASLLQLAVSRQREYLADATGAELLGRASPLADALEALERGAQALPRDVNPATASLYIVNRSEDKAQRRCSPRTRRSPSARALDARRQPDPPTRRIARLRASFPTGQGGEMPPIISRGFRGRRDDAPNNRVPPG
jgi:heat shock protein HtpX